MVQYFPIVTGSLTVTGSVNVSGSITTNSTITATTLVVQTITSSISAITGSTNFGSLSSNTHTFTGSVNVSGSLTVASGSTATPLFTVAGGLVGVGMNPVYKLDVGDAIRGLDLIAGGTTFAYDGTMRARTSGGSTNVLLHSNGTSYFLGGNVGVGTSSPTYKLSVVNDSGDWVQQIKNYGSVAYGLQIDLSASTGGTGGFVIGAYSQTGTGFFLKNNGNVGIGTSNPGYKLVVEQSAANSGLYVNVSYGVSGGNAAIIANIETTAGYLALWRYGGATKGSITTDGGSVAYNTTSDYRLKEDLKDFNGLEKISAIKVYDFKWKNSENRMDGVIAHELSKVIPYAVTGDKDATDENGKIIPQGVDYSKIIPVLVKAIQELTARVQELENK